MLQRFWGYKMPLNIDAANAFLTSIQLSEKLENRVLSSNSRIIEHETPLVPREKILDNIIDRKRHHSSKHRSYAYLLCTNVTDVCMLDDRVHVDTDQTPTQDHEFAQLHPHINISLSKMRKLKKSILMAGKEADLEMVTIAISFIFLERLVAEGKVINENRQVIAAVCILLAVKIHDVALTNKHSLVLDTLPHHLGKVTKKSILKNEWIIFKELKFSLFPRTDTILKHYYVCLNAQDQYREYHISEK